MKESLVFWKAMFNFLQISISELKTKTLGPIERRILDINAWKQQY